MDTEGLKKKKLFLLDMDGTIYLDETLFDGTKELLEYIRRAGGRYLFLSNNSSRGTEAYIQKMKRLGIETTKEDFLTSVDATVDYLKQNYAAGVRYYVCGTQSLKQMLRSAGLVIEEAQEKAEVLLLGYDTELTYEKLCDCVKLLNRGVDYIATHPDLVCPVSFGSAPDCGSVINMLETCCGRRPRIIGKPQPEMVYLAMKRTGFQPEETLLVGDRLYTDIACGVNAGIDTVFVLSGEGTVADIERYQVDPTWILQDVRELYQLVSEE